jgi:hypothetical protein
MIDLFKAHPATVGETYWQHLWFATQTGMTMIAGGSACFLHGLFPFLFVTTGSRTIRRLARRLENRGSQQVTAPAVDTGYPTLFA